MIDLGTVVVCAECKPAFIQKLREGSISLQPFRYAGFWIRAGALTIDNIIGYIFGLMVGGIWLGTQGVKAASNPLAVLSAEGVMIGIQLLFSVAYETWFLGRFGATPGKMTCHLKVVRPDGQRISYMRALVRHSARLISTFTLGIGYLMVSFDEERRSLHDHLCDTRVVRT